MKRILAMMAVLMLIVGVLPIAAMAGEETIRVRVQVEEEMTLYAWAWGDYGNAFEIWPGKEMTKDGESWVADVPVGTTGLVISNGTIQSKDIPIAGDQDVSLKFTKDLELILPPADPVPQDYYLAGCECFTGENWVAASEENKMTFSDGVYTITKKNVPAGKHSFKITDGTWNNSWGGSGEYGNYDFELDEACDVTVEFNPETKEIRLITPRGDTSDVSLTGVFVLLITAIVALAVALGMKRFYNKKCYW